MMDWSRLSLPPLACARCTVWRSPVPCPPGLLGHRPCCGQGCCDREWQCTGPAPELAPGVKLMLHQSSQAEDPREGQRNWGGGGTSGGRGKEVCVSWGDGQSPHRLLPGPHCYQHCWLTNQGRCLHFSPALEALKEPPSCGGAGTKEVAGCEEGWGGGPGWAGAVGRRRGGQRGEVSKYGGESSSAQTLAWCCAHAHMQCQGSSGPPCRSR